MNSVLLVQDQELAGIECSEYLCFKFYLIVCMYVNVNSVQGC
jgi:hypothetical protein